MTAVGLAVSLREGRNKVPAVRGRNRVVPRSASSRPWSGAGAFFCAPIRQKGGGLVESEL